MKQVSSYRFSEKVRQCLSDLSVSRGRSATAVLEDLILKASDEHAALVSAPEAGPDIPPELDRREAKTEADRLKRAGKRFDLYRQDVKKPEWKE